MTIIGGVNAAGKTSGLRCGWSESYLPCRAFVLNQTVKNMFSQATPTVIRYTARARIRNVANTAWVDLGDASYFQVTRNSNGELDMADLAIQKPETWSPYRAGTYADLLDPSVRPLQIIVGLITSAGTHEVPVFQGHITKYTENIGGRSGSISLRIEDLRDVMSRATPVTVPAQVSAWRLIQAQAQMTVSATPGVYVGSQKIQVRIRLPDLAIDTTTTSYGVTNPYDMLKRLVSGIPVMQIKGGGELDVTQIDGCDTNEGLAFSYTDRSMYTIARESGNAAYNVMRTWGLVGGVGTASEVSDAADVLKRGRIVYPPGYIGSPTMPLTQANLIATESLAGELLGKFSASVPFNPLLVPGMWIGIESSKAALAASKVRLMDVQHQFSAGHSVTYLRDLRPIAL